MDKVVGVKIPFINQVYYLDTDVLYDKGDFLIVTSSGGDYLCEVYAPCEPKTIRHQMFKNSQIKQAATNDDIRMFQTASLKVDSLRAAFKKSTKEVNLPIECLGVWPSINGRNIKFFYYASEQVDFRRLITVLLKNISRKARIELCQVGTREYNAILGGFGVCGYELCCHSRYYSTPPITTEVLRYIGYRIDLKDQMFGNCGKYKCCLLFEAEEYRSFMENLPDYYSKIIYEEVEYTVMDLNLFSKNITLQSKTEKIEIHYDEFIKVYNGNNS